jgi:hypothetical protein
MARARADEESVPRCAGEVSEDAMNPSVRDRVSRTVGSLSVRTKILCAVLAAIFVAIAVGGVALTETSKVAAQGKSIYTSSLVPDQQLAELREAVVQARFDVRG